MNPEKTEQRQRALALIEQGVPPKRAAREVGLAEITVRRALAELAQQASDALRKDGYTREDLQEGLQIKREHALAVVVERLIDDVRAVKPGELRDLAVALGILDDKVAGRGLGGQVSINNQQAIVVKTEWPEP